jgi:hypothetical protein
VVPRPAIHAITATNGAVTVAWHSMIGANYNYQLLRAASLSGANWTNVGSPVTATATETSVSELQGLGSAFYRVRVLP